jgi:hypothetical protein
MADLLARQAKNMTKNPTPDFFRIFHHPDTKLPQPKPSRTAV